MSRLTEAQEGIAYSLYFMQERAQLGASILLDGIAEQQRKSNAKILKFFETETDEGIWQALTEEAPLVAQDLLNQWQMLEAQKVQQ